MKRLRFTAALVLTLLVASAAEAQLVAAVLPSSRAVQVSQAATANATIINTSGTPALGCAISPATVVTATFHYQTANSTTNQLTGTIDTPVDIPAHGSQSFVLTLTPTVGFQSTLIFFTFGCVNTAPAPSLPDVNTLRLSAGGPGVDVIAISATPSGDGIVMVPPDGFGAFAVAAVNIGTNPAFFGRVFMDTASPVAFTACRTNPVTAECVEPLGSGSALALDPGTVVTISVFVQRTGSSPFDPARDRFNVTFFSRDSVGGGNNVLVGSTSVAVNTQ